MFLAEIPDYVNHYLAICVPCQAVALPTYIHELIKICGLIASSFLT